VRVCLCVCVLVCVFLFVCVLDGLMQEFGDQIAVLAVSVCVYA